jgi:hypothetical protein
MLRSTNEDFSRIEGIITSAVSFADKHQQAVITLNNVNVIVEQNDTVTDLLWAYWIAHDFPFILSPIAVRAPKLPILQDQVDQLVDRLSQLDQADFGSLIRWFVELQLPSMHPKVLIPATHIYNVLRAKGYLRNCQQLELDRSAAEPWIRYLIAWGLDNLLAIRAVGYLQPKWRLEAEQWLARYGHT